MSDQTPADPASLPEPSLSKPTLPHAAPLEAPELASRSEHAQRRQANRPLWLALAVLALLVVIGGVLFWIVEQGREAELANLQSGEKAAFARLAKLEAQPPPVNLAPLQKAVADLQSRVTALADQPPPQASLDGASRQALAALGGRVDSDTARQDQLGTTEQADIGKLNDQIHALADKVTALGTQVEASINASGAVNALSAQQSRLAQLQGAAAALAAGRPLGDVADAPPALAKFATQPPPTEAALRLSFDAAAQAARQAGEPTAQTVPFFRRLLQRAESSVTVKSGNTLVVGDALSDTLDQARHLLDAGDLSGAVSALNGLGGPAATAMASWRDQAQSLLDARAALISAAKR